MRWPALALLSILFVASSAGAHGDVTEGIAALDRQLIDHPSDAALLAKRASLYALDGRWSDAAGDYEDAYELDPALPGIEHHLANALLHIGEPERAIALLTPLLKREPHHVDAHIVRARAYLSVGETQKAVDDYTQALAASDAPAPRHYRERAQALADDGRIDEAVASLREGIAKLGPIVTLVEPAMELEEARAHDREALALADSLPDIVRHSPEWRARCAVLHKRMGMLQEASAEYRQALATIDALVPSRRESAAMIALRARIERELASVTVVPAAVAPPTHGAWMAVLFGAGALVLARRRHRLLGSATARDRLR